jgi:ribonucleoside-diphosphate reductase alpha chain
MKLNDLPKIDAALAPQAISIDVLLEKYAKGTESSAEDIHARLSHALAAAEQSADQARWHALHKVNGCLRCTNCHHVGHCG